MKTMAAGKFKTNCLAVMDEVQAKRETVGARLRSWAMWFLPFFH